MAEASASLTAIRTRGRFAPRLWIVAVLSVAIGLYGLSYLVGRPAPPGPAQNHAGLIWLTVHASCAGLALLLGPWQFFQPIRTRWPAVHRAIGKSYVSLCLLGGVTGAVLAWNTSSGDVARLGFGLLAAVWLTTTTLAYLAAHRRDFVSHRQWMIRSFAVTFAAVTLRLYLPLSALPGLSFALVYPLTAWAAWIPNLIVAEIWIRTHRV
jgi:hypothetical protein